MGKVAGYIVRHRVTITTVGGDRLSDRWDRWYTVTSCAQASEAMAVCRKLGGSVGNDWAVFHRGRRIGGVVGTSKVFRRNWYPTASEAIGR